MNYNTYTDKALNNEAFSVSEALRILNDPEIELLPLLNSAYQVRKKYWGNKVFVHILNNTENGQCSEDCNYCPQSKKATTPIEEYPMKEDNIILAEAKQAYESGAYRYCLVFSGKATGIKKANKIANLVSKIKSSYNIEVCVSAGLMSLEEVKILKGAGLDRLNHNLNTSVKNYEKICSSHSYQDRLNTLNNAREVNLDVCSGLIVGMGESDEELVEIAHTLRRLDTKSIPINFLLPIKGTSFTETPTNLTPEYCLRVLSLFRFINPKSEIRAAAGREEHLRSMEVLSLYPANSIFIDGYLNVEGEDRQKTFQMISDAGFDIKSDFKLDDFIGNRVNSKNIRPIKSFI